MPPNKLPQCLHRGVRQITWRKGQRTFQGIPHPSTQQHQRTPMDPEQFSIVHKEVNNHSRTQPSTGTWGNTNTCTYGTTCYKHLYTAVQAIQPSSAPHPYRNHPLMAPHILQWPLNVPPTVYLGGGTHFLSTYTCKV